MGRRFDVRKDARRFVKLTDGERLFEAIDTRGIEEGKPPAKGAALCLIDCAAELPEDPFDAFASGEWLTLDRCAELEVVSVPV